MRSVHRCQRCRWPVTSGQQISTHALTLLQDGLPDCSFRHGSLLPSLLFSLVKTESFRGRVTIQGAEEESKGEICTTTLCDDATHSA